MLVFLRTMVDASVEYEELLEKLRQSPGHKTGSASLHRTLQQQTERDKCHRAMVDLYPDWKSGILSREEYLSLKSDLQTRLQTLDSSMLTELVREIRIFEGGRLEITLNFQDELRSLTDYLNTNRESPEPCAN